MPTLIIPVFQPQTEHGKAIYSKIEWFKEQGFEYVFQDKGFEIHPVCFHYEQIVDLVINPMINTIQFGTFRNDWMKEYHVYASELKYGVIELCNLFWWPAVDGKQSLQSYEYSNPQDETNQLFILAHIGNEWVGFKTNRSFKPDN